MVLARILTPDDFGCIGMLAIFIVIANTFVDGGLGSAIIQNKNVTEKDLSTVFFFNLAVSSVLYSILIILSPCIADFYRIPLLSSVLKVQGVILIINSFSVVQTSVLKKRMEFKKIAAASLIAVVISVIFAIVAAYSGWSVWSLVLQQIVYSSVYVVIIWILSHWKPIWVFSKQSFKELFGFGSYIFASNLINNLGNNIQGLIIGRAFNAGIMGYYSQAKKLEEIASTSISNIIDQVTYPALAEKQDDRAGIVNVMCKMIKVTAFVSFPLMIFLAISADIIIPLCYGSQWVQAIPYFSILCLAGIAICMQGINYNAVAAIGKSNSIFKWTVVKRGVALLLILIGVHWGIYGLLIGSVLSSYVILYCNALLVQKFLKYTIWMQIKDLLPILLVTLASGLISYFLFPVLEMRGILNLIVRLAIFATVYLSLACIFKVESAKVIISISKQLINRIKQ